MQFNLFKETIKGIPWDELRVDSDNFFEAVAGKDKIAPLIEKLEVFFNSPVWPSKVKLPSRILQIIDSFGGVNSGQTLYLRAEGNDMIFAMLWPWQDGVHTTVKIFKTPS